MVIIAHSDKTVSDHSNDKQHQQETEHTSIEHKQQPTTNKLQITVPLLNS